jgi:hypothetical protein
MISKEKLTAAGAMQRFDLYCMSHPGTPAAVRRPLLFLRSGGWIVLLGRSIKDGIAGFGVTVESALSSFDTEYRNRLRPPNERLTPTTRGSTPRQAVVEPAMVGKKQSRSFINRINASD